VTHDQKEALSIGRSIAVLKDGRLAQVGTPASFYQSQESLCRDFIGNYQSHPPRLPSRSGIGLN